MALKISTPFNGFQPGDSTPFNGFQRHFGAHPRTMR
jgi:hypothetical protein